MFLSRSGLELNEIWAKQALMLEADERLRELERRWRETGSPEDRAAYARASARTGRHREFMAPFAKEFHSALNAWTQAKPSEMGEEGPLRQRFHRAREEMHRAAKDLGLHENPGHYLPPGNKSHDTHRPDYHSHAWELGFLHGRSGGGYSLGGASFPTPAQRDAFLSSLHHHHGDKGHALGTSEMHLRPPQFIEGSHYVAHYKTPAQVRAGQTLPDDAKPWAPQG